MYVDVHVLCIFYSRRTEHEECLGNVKLSLWSDLFFILYFFHRGEEQSLMHVIF